jgi:ribonuclease P protein component
VPNFQLSKQKRLLSRQEFRKVLQTRDRQISPCYKLFFRRNQFGFARLGVVTAKKMVRLAVQRNTVKRVVREAFRLSQHQLGNYDIVVVARSKAASATKEELYQCLKKLLINLTKA